MKREAKDYVILAADFDSIDSGAEIIQDLAPKVGLVKVGLELFVAEGPMAVQFVKEFNDNVMLDLKLNDISNTVGGATRAAAKHGPSMLTIHASAGREAIAAAVKNRGSMKILGVTVLTSLDEPMCQSIFGDTPSNKVRQFAEMLIENGAQGIVCSPQELRLLREAFPSLPLETVIPGIRPTWAATGDQKRIMTPYEAICAGADYLVMGRPFTKPSIGSPSDAVRWTTDEIEEALADLRKLEAVE